MQVRPGQVDLVGLGLIDETARQDASSMSISNCTFSSGSGYAVYSNCLVGGNKDGKLSMWFYASYTIVQGGYDSISQTSNPGKSCVWPYSCSTVPWRSSFVSKEASYTKAGATYTMPYDHIWGDGTAYMNLQVGANTAQSWITVV